MRKRDVPKLAVGDYIELKHNLGKGDVLEILMEPDKDIFETLGNHPMIKFKDALTSTEHWCTYLMIEFWPNPALTRSKT